MDIHALILDLLYAVIIVAIPILAKYITSYLSTKKIVSNEQITLSLQQLLINDAIQIVNDIVLEISQTYVDSLKKSGSFDADAQKEAFNMAYDNAYKLISKDAKNLITEYYNDFDTWLRTQIEKSVISNKK